MERGRSTKSVAQSFSTFLKEIEITADEAARARALRQEVITRLGPHILGVTRSFPGGSFTRGTAVRPLKDVDVSWSCRRCTSRIAAPRARSA